MSHSRRARRIAAAFTLIELLTVLALLALLAGISIGSINGVTQRTRIARAKTELVQLAQGLEDFKRHYGDYPSTGSTEGEEILFGALTGTLGPFGSLAGGITGPMLVECTKLAFEQAAGASDDGIPKNGSAFLDPWGRRYIYHYDRAAGPGYALFSAGPDGASRRADPAGIRWGTENADDVLAGQSP